ncbi:phosphoinositide 3-kinase regulatory subunit 4 [Agrilus planipennis]|uniref:non-specific serine/threonine protein kinase n=1 Tax=Agrilus planipennis TaxID=224129 RepID=A0A1W4X9V5_AGRPL|nr:phosphoinositide 3-kinase regulatory subunit 4 [Agrilus planipennis]
MYIVVQHNRNFEMGNQLVGIAPSQIYPVEHYLTELTDLKFDISMGSTRFLKVARAESQEGLIVVKVFAIHDPSLPLQPYKDRLEDIRIKLSSAVNCLPFQKIIVNDRAGLIIREYVKYSLYDRISTRPFLTTIEKKWITFQVLYALHQCHKVGVCHGDIKLENITITSWNWILLVDFASFKPTFLPEDNPADYSYFFDTSRRRTCYIAPERFMKTLNSDSLSILTETFCKPGDLKPAMDIFSAGCALLELWNEGSPVFDLSQLLAYRSGDYSPQRHLDKIEDPTLRLLLSSMMQRDPNQRLSAELYLSQERGRLFPEYFYTFLQPYMQIFSSTPILSSDEKISRLKKDIKNIFNFLKTGKNKEEGETAQENEKEDVSRLNCIDDNGLVIITSLVTSCIRGLHDCTTKSESLEILLFLAAHANEEAILDRILPYILFLSRDPNPRVKVAAINTVTQCLTLIKRVPRSDANIFPEYVLPELSPLATDPNTSVRAAYAKNIATLAEIALKFLEQTQTDWCDTRENAGKQQYSGVPRINYEVELQTLHEMVQQSVSTLLTDTQSIVKQTLMQNSITKLCVFFGRQKANDVLLSHIITFLNDKEDKELRGAFFDCIVGVAAYIGWHCSTILTPLLLQGLTDCSEFVTTKSINAMSFLTELGLITKPSLCELVSECSSFLVHPGLWIRLAVVGFVCTVAKNLSILDVQCKVMPILSMYMKYPLIQIERPELVLESLVGPIPRSVFDNVIKYSDIDLLFETLKERQNARFLVNSGRVPSYTDMNSSLKSLFRRLVADGMTDSIEDYLLMMSSHLRKIHKHKTNADAKHNKQMEGRIEINSNTSNVCVNVFNLAENRSKLDYSQKRIQQVQTNTNADWSMFTISNSDQSNSGGSLSKFNLGSRSSSPLPESQHQFSGSNTGNISLHEKSYIQYRTPNCSTELRNLLTRQQMHFLKAVRSKEWNEQAAWQPQLPPPGWRLRGSLVAHLHEHRGSITSLVSFPSSPLFASASVDSYVRIWDCAKMEGKNIANRSKQSYRTTGSVAAMTICENGQSLAAATHDGSVMVVRVDANSKMSLVQSRQVDRDEDGCAVDVQCFDSGPQNLLVYATLYGSIVGWDLRAPGTAWRLENGLKNGVITSFCLDYYHNWLTLGTSSGYHIAWDMRFQLPITSIEHPSGARIRKVISHPTEHSWIISSVQGNNEISMWNLETGFRQCVLWGSSSPPLSKTHMINHSVCAMLSGCIDRSGFLLAGGTDQRVRFWNLHSPTESCLVIPSPNDNISGTPLTYKHRLIDGTSVIQEVVGQCLGRGTGSKSDEVPRAGPEPPPPGHRDCISDIALCKASQCFLLTASRDGVIKIWK